MAVAVRCWPRPSCSAWPKRCCSRSLTAINSCSSRCRSAICTCSAALASARAWVRSATRCSSCRRACRKASAASTRALTSMPETMACVMLPCSSRRAVAVQLTVMGGPRWRRSGLSSFSLSASLKRSSSAWPLTLAWCSAGISASSKRLPTRVADVKPVVRSKLRLTRSMRPCPSSTTTSAPSASRMAEPKSRSRMACARARSRSLWVAASSRLVTVITLANTHQRTRLLVRPPSTKGPAPRTVPHTAASVTSSVSKVAPRWPKRKAAHTASGNSASDAG